MSVKDDLIAARALIESPEKWCKGVDDTRLAADTAISAALGWPRDYQGHGYNGKYEAMRAAKRALLDALPPDDPAAYVASLIVFNDRPATTHADVMALFDRAILAAGASS